VATSDPTGQTDDQAGAAGAIVEVRLGIDRGEDHGDDPRNDHGDHRVAVIVGRWSGSVTAQLPAGDLATAIGDLPPSVEVVVFERAGSAESSPSNHQAVAVEVLETGASVAVHAQPATQAVKRVDGQGRVVEAIDRAQLGLIRPPEAVDRRALGSALSSGLDLDAPHGAVRPSELVLAAGGILSVLPAS
jgi:hypothetical protein